MTYHLDNWDHLLLPENWHPAANMLPMMDPEKAEGELSSLTESIKKYGLTEPVTLLDGKVLDGRNRLVACRLAGVVPIFENWESDGKSSPEEWVLTRNINRRNLSDSQKAFTCCEFLKRVPSTWGLEKVFPDGKRNKRADRRIRLAQLFGIPRHYVTDMISLDQWSRGEPFSQFKKYAKLTGNFPTDFGNAESLDEDQLENRGLLMDKIKNGVMDIPAAIQSIHTDHAKSHGIEDQEATACSSMQLMKFFSAYFHKDAVQAAYDIMLPRLKGADKQKFKRYWERMETEYPWPG
jgi:hypothetical protein